MKATPAIFSLALAPLAVWAADDAAFPSIPAVDPDGAPWPDLDEECFLCDGSGWRDYHPPPKKVWQHVQRFLDAGNTYAWIASRLENSFYWPPSAADKPESISERMVRAWARRPNERYRTCPECTPRPLQLVRIRGVLVPRPALRTLLAAPPACALPDVVPACVDDGCLCLPGHRPIESFVPTSTAADLYAIVATVDYSTAQLPLPLARTTPWTPRRAA